MDLKKLLVVLAVAVAACVAAVFVPDPLIKGAAVSLAVVSVGALETFLKGGGPPPAILGIFASFVVMAMVGAGCAFFDKHPQLIPDVTKEVLCVLSAESDDPAVLLAECGSDIAPIIQDLIAEKKAAKKAGFKLSLDAGADQ